MNEQLVSFLGIPIVGIALSLIVEVIKEQLGTTSLSTKVLVVTLSVLLGVGFFFLVNTALWIPIVGILGSASVFYGFFVKEQS